MNSAPARGAINHIGGLRSALPLTTDIVQPAASRPKSAISGLMRCSKLRLLVDHLVCAGEPRRAGRSRPSILAVLRLTTSSYLVGACNASTSNSLE